MPKKLQTSDKFKFYTQRSIRAEKYELTHYQIVRFKAELPKGIFWIQSHPNSMIQWNWTLLQSFLLHGLDSPITQGLVQEYLDTLPQSA